MFIPPKRPLSTPDLGYLGTPSPTPTFPCLRPFRRELVTNIPMESSAAPGCGLMGCKLHAMNAQPGFVRANGSNRLYYKSVRIGHDSCVAAPTGDNRPFSAAPVAIGAFAASHGNLSAAIRRAAQTCDATSWPVARASGVGALDVAELWSTSQARNSLIFQVVTTGHASC